jgi:hypothetical protein
MATHACRNLTLKSTIEASSFSPSPLPPTSLLLPTLSFPSIFPYISIYHPIERKIPAIMPTAEGKPQTLYDKVFQDHIVDQKLDGTILLYIGAYN